MSRPVTVTVPAVLLLLVGVWRVGREAILPLVHGMAPDPWDALSALVWLVVPIGLLSRERWAWWLAVISSGLTLLLLGLLAGYWERLPDDTRSRLAALRPSLVALGAIVALALGCLLTPSARRAFRG